MIRFLIGTIRCTAVLIAASVALSAGQGRPPDLALTARALLAGGLYEQAEVAAHDELHKQRALQGDDALQVATATDVLVQALILNGRATQDQTLALARHSLRIKEARLGTAHLELALSLLNLGDVLAAAAEFEPAIASTARAVALREGSVPPDGLAVAEALDHLGAVLSSARRYDDALKALERSLRLKEKALDRRDVAIARTLEEFGLVLQRKGAYDASAAPLRRAAAMQEAASLEHPAYARTLNLIAQQLWFEGQLIESKDVSERAVAVAERTLRSDHPTVAQSLRYLAGTLADLGDMGRSLALRERALAIAERNFGPTHHETATYLHTLALAELREGAYTAARQRFRRALNILEARYGPWHEFVATTLLQLARVDASLGDYANARREQSRAVTIHERVGGANHPFVAVALTDLANVYREEGSRIEALRLYERALAIREKNFGPDHREVALTLADMASTLMRMRRSTRAQQLASRALGIWDRLNAPEAPEYATALALYAEIQESRGDHVAARNHYERALQIRASVLGTSHPAYAQAQSGLSLALANLRESDAALRTAAAAEATGRDHLRLMLRSLPERQALNYAAARPRGLNLILSLSGSMHDAIPVAVDGLIRTRALVLDEIAARQSVGHSPSERADPTRSALRSAQQRLANLMARGPGQMSPAQYASLVVEARRESELAEQELAERSVAFRAERSRAQLGLDDVRASLPSDSALVSIARYERTLFTGQTRGPRNVPSYVAFVLQANLPPVVVPFGPAHTIDTLVTQWRADISAEALASAPVSGDGPARSSRQSGAALRRLIWDPVVSHLGNASKVFIVTDGLLNLVPFVALPIGQRSYLLESRIVLHYLSAERDLVPASSAPTPARGLLAIGGASFDDSSLFRGQPAKPAGGRSTPQPATLRDAAQGCGNFQTATFQPLTGTLQEVKELSGVWNAGANSKDLADARVLVGRAASESAFKQEAGNYRVLHLATHGFFLGACSPVTSTTRSVGGLASAGSPKAVDNPLLLSGLAFAGANRRAFAGVDEDDGILTAEEVAALELEGVEWAVLSACDTGLGEVKAGEGVLGLRRAFQVAGARTVIMSLWPVDDQAARAWMGSLYRGRFQNGLSTMEAVRSASLSVLRNRRDRSQSTSPFYWAGFVAAGDWR